MKISQRQIDFLIAIKIARNGYTERISRELVYEQLYKTYGTIPLHDMKIALGDFNVQVGREYILTGTIGKQRYQVETNDISYN